MRKQQEKIIERAKKRKLSDTQIALLAREDLSILELQCALDYFIYQDKYFSPDALTAEVERWISFLKGHKSNIANANDYKLLLNTLLQALYDKKDNLLGTNKKERIFKMYCFLLPRAKDDYYKGVCRATFYEYTDMLRAEHPFTKWHTTTILRHTLQNKNMLIGYKMRKYSCMADDFIHNKNNGLFWYLGIEHDYLQNFIMEEEKLNLLYDFNKHSFCFNKEDFIKVFIWQESPYWNQIGYDINSDYLFAHNLLQYPLFGIIKDFCSQNNFIKYTDSVFGKYEIYQLEDENCKEDLFSCLSVLGQGFIIDKAAYSLSITLSGNFFITVAYNTYKSIYVGASNSNGWRTASKSALNTFMISPDGYLYRKLHSSKRYIPLSLKAFLHLYHENNLVGKLMQVILNFYIKKNVFFKDIVYDFTESSPVMPISFNEIENYYNRADLIRRKYKTSWPLPVKWNKQNLNLSYLIIKATNIVSPGKSRQILLQLKNLSLVSRNAYNGTAKHNTYKFIENVLYEQITKNELSKTPEEKKKEIIARYQSELKEEVSTNVLKDEYAQWINEKISEELNTDTIRTTIVDYVRMCKQTKNKVRLDIYTSRQLFKLHDKITHNPTNYRKETGDVKVPDNSKFNPLREILPAEFEWITTRKRLILETELQHHCVWSYASDITKDKCAIYSFTDINAEHSENAEPKRYTVEFRIRNGTFYVNQVQGKYDRVNSKKMFTYIQKLIST